MGRVSKYKRLKAVDPYNKSNKKQEMIDNLRGKSRPGRKSKKSTAKFDSTVGGGDDFSFDSSGRIVMRGGLSKGSVSKSNPTLDPFDEALESYDPYKAESLEKSISKKSTVGNPYSRQPSSRKSNSTTTTTSATKLFEGKQPHESMRAFNKRIKEETRRVLKDDMSKPVMNSRKKDYLSERKRRKKAPPPGGGGGG
ncbi:hypothetical protein TrRE_jg3767, partial [Triparma retinervis]